ncbi:hypothetical protein UT300007_09010 [Clostridium sp. CTA-7]
MVNAVCLVLMKDEKILLLKRSKNRLPVIIMKGEETPEECVNRWKKGTIEVEDAQIINYNKKINVDEYNISLIFMDATNLDVNLVDENLTFEECRWANNINKIENEFLKYIVLQCNLNNYTSIAVEALKDSINMKKNYKIKNSILNIEKENMDTKKALMLIALSLLFGILFSKFIFGYLGISLVILNILMIEIFFVTVGAKNRNLLGYFFILSSFLLSCSYAIFTNDLFRTLNLFVVPISLFSGFLLLSYNNIPFKLLSFGTVFLEIIVGQSVENSFKLPKVVKASLKKDTSKKENNNIKSILTGILISVPLIIVLGSLLAGADEIFNYYLRNIWIYINIENFYELIYKVIVALIVMFLIFGLYYSLNSTKIKEIDNNTTNKPFNSVTVITVLICIIALYLIFTKIQISYLYLNKELPNGFDFANYARKGFFQLGTLVIINLAIITLMIFKTSTNSSIMKKSLNSLYSIITLLTINMGASAIYKMNLYIEAFGYTRLRILVQVFTVFLCLVLIILMIFIWSKKSLFKPISIVGLSMYLCLNYFNIDNYIAKKNMEIMNSNNEIDVWYLITLSQDAYDSITEGYKQGTIEDKDYKYWKNRRIDKKLKWYEYNYFNSKGK